MSTEWRSARIAMLMAALERHRNNIAKLEERKAKFGLSVPLELENELEDERKMAMEVEAQLEHLMTGGEDPLDRLFREATRARIAGQVGRALQLYEQIRREDPTYPDIAVHVMRTKQEMARDYIDNGGRVIPTLVRPKLFKVEGIGETYTQKLKEAGISTTQALLERGASPQGRKEIAEKTGISEQLILHWVNYVDLFRIKGIGEEYANLLEAAGVDTVPELAQRNPENLYQKLVAVNQETRLVRRLPSEAQVKDWVKQAKGLPRKITY